MIVIDFVVAISIFLSFSLILVLTLWIFYNYKEGNDLNELQHLQQCTYCTYVFFNYKQTELQICPRCKSYISKDDFQSTSN